MYEQIYLWRPRTDPTLPADITSYFAMLQNQGPHGGAFDYRSVLTDVLGWVVERAAGARLADLISCELWRPIGAEFDAEVTVDAPVTRWPTAACAARSVTSRGSG